MGRKQREKKARQQQQQQQAAGQRPTGNPAESKRSKRWIPWVIIIAVILVAAVGITIYYVGANRMKLFSVALYAQAAQEQSELAQRQASFTLAEGRRLAEVLTVVQRLSADPALDMQVAGHMNFVLQVEQEIIKNGNLEPGELDKLEGLVGQAAAMLGRKHRTTKTGAGRP